MINFALHQKIIAMSLESNYQNVLSQIPENVKLVAVSKTHPSEKIKAIYDLGQRAFGENKVQELMEKQPVLPNDIEWHLIGHLQTNKVKYIANFISMIESVDSEKLLKEIDKEALKNNRKINVLLEVKIAKEETKFGLTVDEAKDIFNKYLAGNYPNIEIKGLMGMASFVEDETQIRQEFGVLKKLFDELSQLKPLETLSMGMSGDFPLAIECGSNSVRIGSAIFGERKYEMH
ncbi:YggS family pyridoxal phosphate-dependent enzyme [Chryseobacterium sp. SC28]|uniref:YggS family pyridoxal phosphate-dependent enzyme n=1 Tax=Chryseobacterium sp. SC28 TaxID=2268028 RepID=UPI000F64A148|nr:YggS family pyridoxal phosphate-dependent enzyme [Chryseobacterium sp. SC28]RRQ45116.1 YggS family pyridoxal phosphate-dependent enzyme [Chryseobacterium sp. SC28]